MNVVEPSVSIAKSCVPREARNLLYMYGITSLAWVTLNLMLIE